jgi:alpha-tubulin suppressor-like RCC1 family protein
MCLALAAGCDRVLGLASVNPPDAPLIPAGTWSQIAAGETHVCGVRVDGTLWCWGTNEHGQLGLGAAASASDSPAQVGAASWNMVAAYGATTCGIQSDHSLWCWGDGASGQLGDGGTADMAAPEPIGTGRWSAVAVGGMHACALDMAGDASCWGSNATGQLGLPLATLSALMPTPVPTSLTWLSLVTGGGHTCGLAADHTAWCWGSNARGQLGNGALPTAMVVLPPVQVGIDAWTELAAGDQFTCGLRADSRLRCWGDNAYTELGGAAGTNSPSPVAPEPDLAEWIAIGTGKTHACGARIDGSLWCWGDDAAGQAGDSSYLFAQPPEPIVSGAARWTSVVGGGTITCGTGDDHNAWCFGQLVSGNATLTPQQVAGDWRSVATGTDFTCGIQPDASLWCWGGNYVGQIGDSSYVTRGQPVQIAGPSWLSVSAGYEHACAIRADHALACWGTTPYGLGDDADHLEPTVIAGRAWSSVVIGWNHTCALELGTNAAYCWGDDIDGQLGDNSMTPETHPVAVSGGQTWSTVGSYFFSTCGIASTGDVECWGYGAIGQLGNGFTANELVPTATSPPLIATRLGVGEHHGCAIDTGGLLWCWGENTYGELGTGGGDTLSPVQVSQANTPSTWLDVAASRHTCAIGADRSLWCWGRNDAGEVGNGMIGTEQPVPVQIGVATDWQQIAAGENHACGIRAGGSLWCWGGNSFGQLGLGESFTQPRLEP